MRTAPTLALLLATLVTAFSQGETPPKLELQVTETDRVVNRDRRFEDPKLGKGTKTESEVRLVITVRNLNDQPVEGLKLKAEAVLIPYTWSKNDRAHRSKPVEKDFSLEPNGTFTFEVGPLPYFDTESKKGSTLWRSGYEYVGYNVDVLLDDKVVANKIRGDQRMRQYYRQLKREAGEGS